MVIANIKEYGPAKNWPHDIDIFDGEGQAFMQHLSARGVGQPHLAAATVTVVLQTDQAPQTAVHFHVNNQLNCYSYQWTGLVPQEYRSTRGLRVASRREP